jgi:hypothetical protein
MANARLYVLVAVVYSIMGYCWYVFSSPDPIIEAPPIYDTPERLPRPRPNQR